VTEANEKYVEMMAPLWEANLQEYVEAVRENNIIMAEEKRKMEQQEIINMKAEQRQKIRDARKEAAEALKKLKDEEGGAGDEADADDEDSEDEEKKKDENPLEKSKKK
jgi:hypothetical protein